MSYIAFEGAEGSGKSTVIRRVGEQLTDAGREVIVVREPGGTPVAEAIRSIVLGTQEMSDWAEALLFAAQRSDLAERVIRPALARDAIVLADRSVYSSLAYQGIVRGLGLEAVRAANETGLGGTWPDRVFVLEVEPQLGLDRQSDPDRIGGSGLAFQTSVVAAYRFLAAQEPGRLIVVDAGGTVDETVAAVMQALRGDS